MGRQGGTSRNVSSNTNIIITLVNCDQLDLTNANKFKRSKDVRLPVQLQRAMAAEAEATREARAKVIAAEGEQRASRALKEAAEVISGNESKVESRTIVIKKLIFINSNQS